MPGWRLFSGWVRAVLRRFTDSYAPVNARRRRARKNLRRLPPSPYPPCPVCFEHDCHEHCPWCGGDGFTHADDCPVVINVYPVGRWESLACAVCSADIVYGESYSYLDTEEWGICCLGCACRSGLGIGFV